MRIKGNRTMSLGEIAALRKAVATLVVSQCDEESAVGKVLQTALTRSDDERSSADITMQALKRFDDACMRMREELRGILG